MIPLLSFSRFSNAVLRKDGRATQVEKERGQSRQLFTMSSQKKKEQQTGAIPMWKVAECVTLTEKKEKGVGIKKKRYIYKRIHADHNSKPPRYSFSSPPPNPQSLFIFYAECIEKSEAFGREVSCDPQALKVNNKNWAVAVFCFVLFFVSPSPPSSILETCNVQMRWRDQKMMFVFRTLDVVSRLREETNERY